MVGQSLFAATLEGSAVREHSRTLAQAGVPSLDRVHGVELINDSPVTIILET
jgi:hypothetical protein